MNLRTRVWCSMAAATLVAACQLGNKSIGGLDSGDTGSGSDTGVTTKSTESSGTDTDPTGGDELCMEPPPVELDFLLTGLEPGETELTLGCEAAVDGSSVTLAGCRDGDALPHADLELTLTGDWTGAGPSLDSLEGPVTLRYVEDRTAFRVQRWLRVETDQFPLALVGIDASTLLPAGGGFDYAPVDLETEALECPPIDDTCGSIARLAVRADYSDDQRSIPEGTQIVDLGAADGGDSTQFVVTVALARELLDNQCEDADDRRLLVGILAYPNS